MMPFDAASFEDEDSRQHLKSGQRIKAEELTTEDGTSIAKCDVLSSKPKTRAEKEIIRKRKYHQRLKNEREALRELVSKLSAQLHDLKQQNTISMALVNSNWRDSALSQLLERQRVETEQIKLFAAAKMQALYINNLCGQLPGNATTRLLIQATTARPSNPLFDYTKYSAHVQSVNECYAQVDDVLREFKVSTVQDGVTSSLHYRTNEEEVEYFQHLNKFTEPYNYEQTHQTMWKLAKLQHRQQDRHTFEGLGSPDDTVVIRFRLVRSFTSEMTVSVLQRYVFRRLWRPSVPCLCGKRCLKEKVFLPGCKLRKRGGSVLNHLRKKTRRW